MGTYQHHGAEGFIRVFIDETLVLMVSFMVRSNVSGCSFFNTQLLQTMRLAPELFSAGVAGYLGWVTFILPGKRSELYKIGQMNLWSIDKRAACLSA